MRPIRRDTRGDDRAAVPRGRRITAAHARVPRQRRGDRGGAPRSTRRLPRRRGSTSIGGGCRPIRRGRPRASRIPPLPRRQEPAQPHGGRARQAAPQARRGFVPPGFESTRRGGGFAGRSRLATRNAHRGDGCEAARGDCHPPRARREARGGRRRRLRRRDAPRGGGEGFDGRAALVVRPRRRPRQGSDPRVSTRARRDAGPGRRR